MIKPCSGYAPASIGSRARPRRLAIAILVVLLLIGVSACGFRLRGQVEIPPEFDPIFVQPEQGSPVASAIVQQLRESRIELAERPQDARLILRISNESSSSRVVAVDRQGKELASELRYRLRAEAVTPKGEALVPRQPIEVTRSLQRRDVAVLGEEAESEMLRDEMVRDAADRVLNRLRAMLFSQRSE